MDLAAIPVLVMGGITLYVGVFYLLIWLRMREDRTHLYFFFLCAAVAAYDLFSALLYDARRFEASIWFQRGQFAAIGAIASLLLLFAARFLRQKLSAWLRLLLGLYAAFALLAWIDSPLFLHLEAPAAKTVHVGALTVRYLELHPGAALTAFYALLLAGIITALAAFWRLYRRRREPRLLLFQAAVFLFLLAAVNDILVGAGALESLYLLEYSFLAVILAVDFLMQHDYLKLIRVEKRHAVELAASLASLKTLKGLLPICAGCKKIRNDDGYWQQVEVYVSEHSEAGFSHCICPECARRLYPEYYREEPKPDAPGKAG